MHEHHPPKEACICETIIKVERSIPWNVFLYYSIDQLYQNYLPYSGSIDPKQQYGHRNASKSECGNFTTINVTRHGHRPVPTPIAPCGMLANSFFNDTIELFLIFTHPKVNTPNFLSISKLFVLLCRHRGILCTLFPCLCTRRTSPGRPITR